MKKLANYMVILGIVGLLLTAGLWAYAKSITRAATIVERSAASTDLFGDSSGSGLTPLGSEQVFISLDKGMFFEQDGKSYIDKAYLESKKVYPFQFKTVNTFAQAFVAGFGAVVVLGLLLGRKKAK